MKKKKRLMALSWCRGCSVGKLFVVAVTIMLLYVCLCTSGFNRYRHATCQPEPQKEGENVKQMKREKEHTSLHHLNDLITIATTAVMTERPGNLTNATKPVTRDSQVNESSSGQSVGVGGSEEGRGGGGGEVENGVYVSDTDHEDENTMVKKLFESKMQRRLNYDLWHCIVGFTVDDMRIVKTFPSSPDERTTINSLHVEFNETDPGDINGKYGHRIYGFLIPPQQGEYMFSIEMSDVTALGDVELWLSNDSNPNNMKKIAVLEYSDQERRGYQPPKPIYKKVESKPIQLNATAHYIEFLEKAYDGSMTVDIKWKTPSTDNYIEIGSENFAMAATINSDGSGGPEMKFFNSSLPSSKLQSHDFVHYVGEVVNPVTTLDVLRSCKFTAVYARPCKVKPLFGGKQVFESKVYPDDHTVPKNSTSEGFKDKFLGSFIISSEIVHKIFFLYTKALNAKYEDAKVLKIHHLELTPNKSLRPVRDKKNRRKLLWPHYGDRFLIEMEVRLEKPVPRVVYTSEYAYMPRNSDKLCHTSNFQWKRSGPANVYLVVALKNLGVWVDHLIQNFEDIFAATRDRHFELVVVDYDSVDISVEGKLKASSINRWHYIKKTGNFSRSGGLQAGIDYVTDPNSIVMTIDMHLTLPPGLIEYVRRHTIQGKMACAPFFFRLGRGYTEVNMNGLWEIYTYGVISMFKSDWKKTGGFNLAKYTTNWGGEDWDMVDRIISHGYEIFRIRYPGFVHYYHTKAGMWGVDGAKKRPR